MLEEGIEVEEMKQRRSGDRPHALGRARARNRSGGDTRRVAPRFFAMLSSVSPLRRVYGRTDTLNEAATLTLERLPQGAACRVRKEEEKGEGCCLLLLLRVIPFFLRPHLRSVHVYPRLTALS